MSHLRLTTSAAYEDLSVGQDHIVWSSAMAPVDLLVAGACTSCNGSSSCSCCGGVVASASRPRDDNAEQAA